MLQRAAKFQDKTKRKVNLRVDELQRGAGKDGSFGLLALLGLLLRHGLLLFEKRGSEKGLVGEKMVVLLGHPVVQICHWLLFDVGKNQETGFLCVVIVFGVGGVFGVINVVVVAYVVVAGCVIFIVIAVVVGVVVEKTSAGCGVQENLFVVIVCVCVRAVVAVVGVKVELDVAIFIVRTFMHVIHVSLFVHDVSIAIRYVVITIFIIFVVIFIVDTAWKDGKNLVTGCTQIDAYIAALVKSHLLGGCGGLCGVVDVVCMVLVW